jgi:hypothetical protein
VEERWDEAPSFPELRLVPLQWPSAVEVLAGLPRLGSVIAEPNDERFLVEAGFFEPIDDHLHMIVQRRYHTQDGAGSVVGDAGVALPVGLVHLVRTVDEVKGEVQEELREWWASAERDGWKLVTDDESGGACG